MQTLQETLGLRLEVARVRNRMTLRELGKATGIPAATLSRYERDQTVPPLMKLEIIAAVLGVSVASIVDPEHSATGRKLSRSRVPVAA